MLSTTSSGNFSTQRGYDRAGGYQGADLERAALSRREHEQGVDGDPHQGAHHSPVDPDELEVSA